APEAIAIATASTTATAKATVPFGISVGAVKRNRDARVTKTLLSVSITFLVCYLPFAVVTLLSFLVDHRRLNLAWPFTYALTYVNNCLNFPIYVISQPLFRRELRRIFCCCLPRRRDHSRSAASAFSPMHTQTITSTSPSPSTSTTMTKLLLGSRDDRPWAKVTSSNRVHTNTLGSLAAQHTRGVWWARLRLLRDPINLVQPPSEPVVTDDAQINVDVNVDVDAIEQRLIMSCEDDGYTRA
ncbi:unnamed protein product, partial [Protopolystoma xenopodis]